MSVTVQSLKILWKAKRQKISKKLRKIDKNETTFNLKKKSNIVIQREKVF